MSKFTAGPWSAVLVPTQVGSAYKFPPTRVCLYIDNMRERNVNDSAWNEQHANARLIAAAPDLFAALQEIADGCVSYRPGHVNYESNRTKDQIRAIAEAAIAKATT